LQAVDSALSHVQIVVIISLPKSFFSTLLDLWSAFLPQAGPMHLGTNIQGNSGAIALQGAVLCVDCECISNGLSDECLVCGSRSLFNLERMLGATEPSHKARYSEKNEKIVLFDAEITVKFKQIEPTQLSANVEGIARLIEASFGRDQACFHVNVEPVVVCGNAEATRAA
jgi:hypothetical protein